MRTAAGRPGQPRVAPSITQNNGPTGNSARASSQWRSCSQPNSSMPTSPRRPPLPVRTNGSSCATGRVVLGKHTRLLDAEPRPSQHDDHHSQAQAVGSSLAWRITPRSHRPWAGRLATTPRLLREDEEEPASRLLRFAHRDTPRFTLEAVATGETGSAPADSAPPLQPRESSDAAVSRQATAATRGAFASSSPAVGPQRRLRARSQEALPDAIHARSAPASEPRPRHGEPSARWPSRRPGCRDALGQPWKRASARWRPPSRARPRQRQAFAAIARDRRRR
jgi:hypothetical protein